MDLDPDRPWSRSEWKRLCGDPWAWVAVVGLLVVLGIVVVL